MIQGDNLGSFDGSIFIFAEMVAGETPRGFIDGPDLFAICQKRKLSISKCSSGLGGNSWKQLSEYRIGSRERLRAAKQQAAAGQPKTERKNNTQEHEGLPGSAARVSTLVH